METTTATEGTGTSAGEVELDKEWRALVRASVSVWLDYERQRLLGHHGLANELRETAARIDAMATARGVKLQALGYVSRVA